MPRRPGRGARLGVGTSLDVLPPCYRSVMSVPDTTSNVPDAPRRPRLFAPSAAALNWVISIGFVSLGYAMYLRYLVIEQPSVGLACDVGLKTWLCLSRKVATALMENYVFGWVSLGAAVLALIRPSVPLFTIALAATAFGIVLMNASLSGFAAALLIMCFARPVTETG
jgi:hypothetical protein